MSHCLCLSFRLLDFMFHGRGDGGKPEWPPSPLRAFQALVAAAGQRWRKDQLFDANARDPLAWLEGLGSPKLIAPTGVPSSAAYRLYVPNNHADIVAAAWSGGDQFASIAEHRVEKDVRSTHLCGSDTVHYLWPINPDRPEYVQALNQIAREVSHLGWGIDQAAASIRIATMSEVDTLVGDRWIPAERGGIGLRVPQPAGPASVSTLGDLRRKHADFLARLGPDSFKPVTPLSAFRVIGYRRATDPLHRPFVAFRLWHPEEDRMAYFPATRAVTVAATIRHATAEAARRSGWHEDAVVQYVLGHRDNPDDTLARFAFVPLPTIEPPPRNVAGGIRRVLIAEPLDSPGQHVGWLRQFMPGQVITDDEGIEVAFLERIETDGVVRRYVDRATTWTTVTPVALPGSDEGKPNKTDKLLQKMFRHAGYSIDAVAELDFHRVPFLRGAEDAKRYRPREPHYLANCTMYHMRIRWKHPMPGPIVLGSGRFCGLGVFAAIDD